MRLILRERAFLRKDASAAGSLALAKKILKRILYHGIRWISRCAIEGEISEETLVVNDLNLSMRI